jgi:glycosyltransferase involved in cell wall biosynthesis
MNLSHLPVSAIVLTHNEEANIEECLASLKNWASEVFVVDSGSTDRTLDIVRCYTQNIVVHPFETYAHQRNWAQFNLPLTHEWVFHIDADERVTPALSNSIHNLFAGEGARAVQGALMARRTIFMGRPILHGGHYPVYHARLFRRDAGRCEDKLYDQHFIVSGKSVTLEGDLIDLITSDLRVWTQRHAVWGELEAQEQSGTQRDRTNAGHIIAGQLDGDAIQQRRWLRTSVYDRAPLFLRSFLYFFYRYVIRLGFLDGVEGLIFHFLQGCWFRFYIDSKIWEMRRKTE